MAENRLPQAGPDGPGEVHEQMAQSRASGELSPSTVLVVILLTLVIVGVVGWWVTLKPRTRPAGEENRGMMQQMQQNMPGSTGAGPPKPPAKPAH